MPARTEIRAVAAAACALGLLGAGIALDHLDVIKRSLPTEEENLVGLFPGPELR